MMGYIEITTITNTVTTASWIYHDFHESETKMDVFAELFKSDVGILSSITIVVCVLISVVIGFWVRKQVKKDEQRHQQNQAD